MFMELTHYFSNNRFDDSVCLSVHLSVSHSTHVEVRGQFGGIGCCFYDVGFWGLNSGRQAQQREFTRLAGLSLFLIQLY